MNNPARKQVFIVDDHSIVRQGLALIINQSPDLEVTASAADQVEALAWLQEHRPDAVVVDLTLKESSGLDLIKEIRVRGWTFPILVLSMHDEAMYAERSLRAGANGYIMKEQAEDAVIEGLRAVLKGEMYVSKAVLERMLQHYLGDGNKSTGMQTLSDRELQIFEMFGRGRTTQEIADALDLSVKTIEAHRVHIKKKLDIAKTSQLMQEAVLWTQRMGAPAQETPPAS